MKKTRWGRLVIPMGLGIALLASILISLSLFTQPTRAAALPQTVEPVLPRPELASFLSVDQAAKKADDSVQATEALSISNIIGATYDQARGEVIVFGVADPDLPALDFSYIRENLVIALRAFYDPVAPEIPGVSIEGVDDPLEVVYFGTVTDTHFGQVSFETDRLLKIYTMGVDNVTGLTVTSNVTGYMSYPKRMEQLEETESDPILIRYFFTPTLLAEPIASPHTILFSRTQKLIDWAYMSATTSAASAEAAQGFVDNFNQYYWDYAAERSAADGDTTLYEMAQLSKLTAIAQWIHDQNLELVVPGLNAPWLSHYPVAYAETATQTPGIAVTWVQTIGGTPYESSLRGGVYAVGDIGWIAPTIEGQKVADDVYDALDSPQPLMIPFVLPNRVRPLEESSESEGPLVVYVIPLADNAVLNGDFEDGQGSAPWGQDSFFEMIRSSSPHNGTYAAQFPVYNNAQVAMSQTLCVPADATMARLTYWRAAATDETTHPHDFFASFLADADGRRLITLETLDDGDADGFWHQVSFDTSVYAGHTVQLWFTATTDGNNITNFFVDDVSLDYLDPIPPTVADTIAPDRVAQTGAVEFEVVFHERMKTDVVPKAMLILQGTQISHTLMAKTGAGYTNGYLDSDPTRWYGTFAFTPQMAKGTYDLDVSTAQDLAWNVMYPADNVHTLTFDVTSLQVQDTWPPEGASGVPVDASVVISFNKAVNTSTLNYDVSPDPGGWAESWDSANKVATLAHNRFDPGATYTVTIIEAQDLEGNSLSYAPVVWSFTTLYQVCLPVTLKSFEPASSP
jgi:hypothetical protein